MADMNLLNEILNTIMVCACTVLDDGLCDEPGSTCGCPCRTALTVGPPVADIEACCSDGALFVGATELYPFTNFPARQGSTNTCQSSLAADVTVTLFRCWPAVIKDDGSSPTAAEIQAASERIYRDQYLLTWGLICCLKEHGRKRKFLLKGSRAFEPQGGCVKIEVTLTVEIFDVASL